MKVYLIGIGMGTYETLTKKAEDIIKNADILIGAERMTEPFKGLNKAMFTAYKPDEIVRILDNCNGKNAAVLLSGDVGFYSGAKKLIQVLNGYDLELVTGISSLAYFCARLKLPWQEVKPISLHGKNSNAVGYIKRYPRVFMLLSGAEDLRKLTEKLCYYNLGHVVLNIGQRLSYEDEKILTVRAEDIREFDFDKLLVVLAENDCCMDLSMSAIADDEFIRSDVPMTKSEIRTISLARLGLQPDSIVYDIGSGTGSVAVEAALKCIDGRVYAVEKKENAIELIEKNKRKFATDNIEIIAGEAPDVLEALPEPTHIFVGGSGGNIEKIIEYAIINNPRVKIVINVIALNTLSQLINVIDKFKLKADIVCINGAREKLAGNYRLMMGQNPVYIITIN